MVTVNAQIKRNDDELAYIRCSQAVKCQLVKVNKSQVTWMERYQIGLSCRSSGCSVCCVSGQSATLIIPCMCVQLAHSPKYR